MEVGGGPIAGIGCAHAEWPSGYRSARPHGRCLRFFYGHSVRHLRSDYCDPGEPSVCRRVLHCSALLRNLFDPALVASEKPPRRAHGLNAVGRKVWAIPSEPWLRQASCYSLDRTSRAALKSNYQLIEKRR